MMMYPVSAVRLSAQPRVAFLGVNPQEPVVNERKLHTEIAGMLSATPTPAIQLGINTRRPLTGVITAMKQVIASEAYYAQLRKLRMINVDNKEGNVHPVFALAQYLITGDMDFRPDAAGKQTLDLTAFAKQYPEFTKLFLIGKPLTLIDAMNTIMGRLNPHSELAPLIHTLLSAAVFHLNQARNWKRPENITVKTA